MIKMQELADAMRRLSVQTGSLACLGCGHEHGCSVHGCAILKAAADALDGLSEAQGKADAMERVAKHYKAQRDAAVEQLRKLGDCSTCAKDKPCGYDSPECTACTRGQNWEWNGGKQCEN